MENIFSFDSPDHSTAYLIVRLANLHQRTVNAKLAEQGMTYSQFILLSGVYWLEYKRQEATQVALSDIVKFDKSTVSSVLKTLIVKKHITRREHPADTRAKIVSITAHGIKSLKGAIAVVYSVDKAMYEDVDMDRQKLNSTLMEILRANE